MWTITEHLASHMYYMYTVAITKLMLSACIFTQFCFLLRLYSSENTAVIPQKMIALELAAEVVTCVVALLDIKHERETASSRFWSGTLH